MKIVNGDLLDLFRKGEFDAIGHCCNCFCKMGAGIAGQISKQFPLAYDMDKTTIISDYNKLGNYTKATVEISDKTLGSIYNLYGQYRPGSNFDPVAFELATDKMSFDLPKGSKVGLPYKIGCGIAGGNWDEVFDMLSFSSLNKIHQLTLVKYEI